MKLYVNDIFKKYNIQKSECNTNAIKAIISVLKEKELCTVDKQRIIIDDKNIDYYINTYLELLNHFDPNYNRKEDFMSLYRYIVLSQLDNQVVNFNSLFCPGYTKYGYKNKLGHTTIWKLEELSKVRETLNNLGIYNTFKNYYSDVFLENFNSEYEPNWYEQMSYNRELFHKEGEKYFNKEEVLDASTIPIFSNKDDIYGHINNEIIENISKKTYTAFVKSNKNFYEKLGFDEVQMKNRNDRLITMYRELSDYFNTMANIVFLPMENMYERENIFSENKTCTMYLKLKR